MSMLTKEDVAQHVKHKRCGGCRHWHRWTIDREREYWRFSVYSNFRSRYFSDLHFGDCAKIANKTPYPYEVKYNFFDITTFEDEFYDDVFHCFESVVQE